MSNEIPQPTRWRRLGWLIGLPLLALVWGGATFVTQSFLEATLKDRVAVVIRDCGQAGTEPWLRVEIRGRDLIAHGEASDAPMRTAALERLAALADTRRLVDRTAVIQQASPFVWQARLAEPARIELSGNRPAEIGASALSARLTSALPPGFTLSDETRAARGASPAFQSGAAFAMAALRGLKPGAVVTLSDTVIALDGEAADAETYAALTVGLTPPQGFSLGRVAILAPRVDDFRYGVERRPDGGVTLTGYVVSETVRSAIRAALAASPNASVDDRMRTARGLPASVDAETLGRFTTRLASLVHDGVVSYANEAVSVSGVVIDSQAVGEIEALLRDERPSGVSAGRTALTARAVSPYGVTIARTPDSVVLSGHLPSAAARADLVALMRQRFIQESVRDTTRIAEGGPDGLVPALKTAVAPLSTLARGQVDVSDNALRFVGESLYGESARRLQATLAGSAPRGWMVTAQVTSPETVQVYDAASCSRQFAETTMAHPIRFATASSELKPEFYPVLDALAELARHCPDHRVEIVGHADPAGSPGPQVAALPEYTASIKPKEKPAKAAAKPPAKAAAKDAKGKAVAKAEPEAAEAPAEPKLDLPQQRAAAIVDYLLKAGLEPSRLVWSQTAQPLSQQQGIGFQFRS